MMQRYRVLVSNRLSHEEKEEIHQADSWQSAVLSHSWIGAEFEGLLDEKDLSHRCGKYHLYIDVEDLRDVQP